MYTLISASPSPYARKVRISLAEKRIPFELTTEVPWESTTSTPRYNPLEKLPVLIPENGHAVYESSFILQYLETMHPEPSLMPENVDDKLTARRLEVLCDGICDAVVLTFFERMREHPSNAWTTRQQRKIEGGLKEIARIVGSREWAVGNRFSLGDVAAGTVTGWLAVRFPEFEWKDSYPGLANLSDRLEQRESFRNSAPIPQTIKEAVV